MAEVAHYAFDAPPNAASKIRVRVGAGGELVLHDDGRPMARVVPIRRRRIGPMKGKPASHADFLDFVIVGGCTGRSGTARHGIEAGALPTCRTDPSGRIPVAPARCAGPTPATHGTRIQQYDVEPPAG